MCSHDMKDLCTILSTFFRDSLRFFCSFLTRRKILFAGAPPKSKRVSNSDPKNPVDPVTRSLQSLSFNKLQRDFIPLYLCMLWWCKSKCTTIYCALKSDAVIHSQKFNYNLITARGEQKSIKSKWQLGNITHLWYAANGVLEKIGSCKRCFSSYHSKSTAGSQSTNN